MAHIICLRASNALEALPHGTQGSPVGREGGRSLEEPGFWRGEEGGRKGEKEVPGLPRQEETAVDLPREVTERADLNFQIVTVSRALAQEQSFSQLQAV
jgi:hypothetical protein